MAVKQSISVFRFLARLFEEIFPFVQYLISKSCLQRQCCKNDILSDKKFMKYTALPENHLRERLNDEHERASKIDEKTFKLTLSLSIGLSILGSFVAFFAKSMWANEVIVILGIGIFYVLVAGFIALGALKTLPLYGYGTNFTLEVQANNITVLADALARQETINLIRHLRNESAYQTLRNGLFMIFVGIVLIFTTLILETTKICESNNSPILSPRIDDISSLFPVPTIICSSVPFQNPSFFMNRPSVRHPKNTA